MATVLATFRIMPESVDVGLDEIELRAREAILEFGGEVGNTEKEPIAFGLVSLKIVVVLDENKSNLDPLEEKLRAIHGVASAEVVDVRRAIG